MATSLKQKKGRSITDLTLTTPDLGDLPAWTIDLDCATTSDLELITFDLEKIDKTVGSQGKSTEITGWAIKETTIEQEGTGHQAWKEKSEKICYVNGNSRENLDDEVKWISEILTTVLNQYARKVRICALSKRWWSQEINLTRSNLKRTRQQFQRQQVSTEEHKVMRNAYHGKIKQTSDQCFEKWIQGEDERYDIPSENPTHEDTWENKRRRKDEDERCWTALSYTKDWATNITPVLKGQNGSMAVAIEDEKDLAREFNFPVSPSDDQELPELTPGEEYKTINMDLLHKALSHQSARKAPSPDRINFHAIHIIWS